MIEPQVIALDVYGTLIDTSGVLDVLRDVVGGQAEEVSSLWRTKQLEYSFRRGLMKRYVDFSIITREALTYSCNHIGISLSNSDEDQLLASYKSLPAFDDALAGVKDLKNQGHRIYAYSNGSHQAIKGLLSQAGILPLLDGTVSMEDVATFKPSPEGYHHFCTTTGVDPSVAWMVSSNTFDVIGAASAGMKTAWLHRNKESTFDPMGYEPTVIIDTLDELSHKL